MSSVLHSSQKKKYLPNHYLTALTKYSRPILKLFLQSELIFTLLKTLKSQFSKMNLSVLAVPWHGCQKKNCRKIAPQPY
jgi:hypothetical protein